MSDDERYFASLVNVVVSGRGPIPVPVMGTASKHGSPVEERHESCGVLGVDASVPSVSGESPPLVASL